MAFEEGKSGRRDAQTPVHRFYEAKASEFHNRPGGERRRRQGLETRQIDAFGEPQPHQQKFVGALLAR